MIAETVTTPALGALVTDPEPEAAGSMPDSVTKAEPGVTWTAFVAVADVVIPDTVIEAVFGVAAPPAPVPVPETAMPETETVATSGVLIEPLDVTTGSVQVIVTVANSGALVTEPVPEPVDAIPETVTVANCGVMETVVGVAVELWAVIVTVAMFGKVEAVPEPRPETATPETVTVAT